MILSGAGATLPGVTEAQLQQGIVDTARALGYRAYHPFDSRRSTAGWPDLVLAKPGRVLFVELKAEGKQPRPEQQWWLDTLESADLEVHVWRPEHYLDGTVEAVLRAATV